DEALAQCTTDISGRAFLVFNADFTAERIGSLETQTIIEFFRAFAMNSGMTIHINLLYGDNDHHKAEAIFKAFAHALRLALKNENGNAVLSTKGSLG
ncbi:MAG: imidazoleglycerol-phosphate dehydratase, partial [Eubacteriales bacterium]|nr:imidazoleglycerol-phosphate dehydratase [Eubacteriales bacterium]